jgi:hypothetical protein
VKSMLSRGSDVLLINAGVGRKYLVAKCLWTETMGGTEPQKSEDSVAAFYSRRPSCSKPPFDW